MNFSLFRRCSICREKVLSGLWFRGRTLQVVIQEKEMDIKGKTIVITGGGQGLGRAMAVAFAKDGANLALIDLNEEPLAQTVQLCKDAGGDARSYLGNIAKEDEVIATFDAIEADFGEIHGLINNAGILRDGLLIKVKDGNIDKRMSLAEWQAVIDVNLTGVFLCGREAATPPPKRNVRRRGRSGGRAGWEREGMVFFFSSRRRHTRLRRDWSSDVCSSDLPPSPSNRSPAPSSRPPRSHPAPRPRAAERVVPVSPIPPSAPSGDPGPQPAGWRSDRKSVA